MKLFNVLVNCCIEIGKETIKLRFQNWCLEFAGTFWTLLALKFLTFYPLSFSRQPQSLDVLYESLRMWILKISLQKYSVQIGPGPINWRKKNFTNQLLTISRKFSLENFLRSQFVNGIKKLLAEIGVVVSMLWGDSKNFFGNWVSLKSQITSNERFENPLSKITWNVHTKSTIGPHRKWNTELNKKPIRLLHFT